MPPIDPFFVYGEFLKELDLTEGRSTGIPKILKVPAANGSSVPLFETDSDEIGWTIGGVLQIVSWMELKLCWRDLSRLSPLLGISQDDMAPMNVGDPPFLDLLQGSKAAAAGKVIV
jgi:hypothetical protein